MRPWQPVDRQRSVATALRACAALATSADKGAVRYVPGGVTPRVT